MLSSILRSTRGFIYENIKTRRNPIDALDEFTKFMRYIFRVLRYYPCDLLPEEHQSDSFTNEDGNTA
ncbi:hypothetical protein Tco_0179328 [Tanacetum coccineum]